MIGYAMWIVTAASLTGTVLNIRRSRKCFVIWVVTNALWSTYDASIGAYAQSALHAVYTGLAVWGLIAWRKGIKE